MRTIWWISLGGVLAVSACAKTPSVVYIEQISPPVARSEAAAVASAPAGSSGGVLQAP